MSFEPNEFANCDGMTLMELIREMRRVQMAKDEAETELKKLNKHFDFLRITKVPQMMEDEGIRNLNVEGVGRVSLTADMHVSIKDGQKESFYEWLRDNGRSDLIQPNVNPSTLKATVKNMVKEGEVVPEEMLNVSPFTRASITKA
jgi:hypothetical protein